MKHKIQLTKHMLLGLALPALALAALFPPGPTKAQDITLATLTPTPADNRQGTVTESANLTFVPIAYAGQPAPDLVFSPDNVLVAPGQIASVQVRVEPEADMNGATFDLDDVQDGVTNHFEAAPGGKTGTLTIEASSAAEAGKRKLEVHGTSGDGSKHWVGKLTVATDQVPGGRFFFADPANGKDSNDGSQGRPFKTLTKALSVSKNGDTINLAQGGYGTTPSGAGSGETIPVSGLVVPHGVRIIGATENGFPATTLLGNIGGVGLVFQGDGVVKNLLFGGGGFGVGMFAKQGAQTVSNVFVGATNKPGIVDGVSFTSAIVLRGTAKMTLKAGTSGSNTSGTTIFLLTGTGVSAFEQAQFTMSGGTITGGGEPNCNTSVTGIELHDSAKATLNTSAGLINPLTFRNIAGSALVMSDGSSATLNIVQISRNLTASCEPAASISVGGTSGRSSGSLTTTNTFIVQSGNFKGIGLSKTGDATVKLLTNTNLNGYNKSADISGNGDVIVDGAFFDNYRTVAIDVGSAQGNVTITNSEIQGAFLGSTGIIASQLKLRNSRVASTRAIEFAGTFADLGTIADPGNNTILSDFVFANGQPGNGVFINGHNVSGLVSAVGNTWLPNTQGADAGGHYTQHILVHGTDPLGTGRNFRIGNTQLLPNFAVQL